MSTRDGRGPTEPTPAALRLQDLFNRPRAARTDGDAPRLDVQKSSPERTFRLAADTLVSRIVEIAAGGNPLAFWRRNDAPPVILLEDYFVTGPLNLRAIDFPYLLEFVRCRFDHPIDLRQANLAGLQFSGCWLPGLSARNLRSASGVVLTDSTVHGAPLDITDSDIKGSLVLHDSRLENPNGCALRADRLAVAGGLLAARLHVEGEIRLPGTKIGGNVELHGATLHNPVGFTVNGNGMQVGGSVLLITDPVSEERFTSTGTMYLPGARIFSELSLRGAELVPGERAEPPAQAESTATAEEDNPYWDPNASLVADRVEVSGDVEFDQGFASSGTLRMVNARIGGSLRMAGASVDLSGEDAPDRPRDRALHLDGMEVRGDLNLRRATISGQIRMMNVRVKGSALLDRAQLANPKADVLLAQRLEVGGDVNCQELQASGSLLLRGATIGANLDLRGARLIQPGTSRSRPSVLRSVDLRAAKIGRDLVCTRGEQPFSAHGGVRMRRAEIGRQANFSGAVLGDKLDGVALNAFGVSTQDLVLTVAEAPRGAVNLRHVRCASLADNEQFWEATGRVDVEDFRYDALATRVELKDDNRVTERLRWLRQALRPSYQPGPYDQLAAVFRASGNEEHASTVLMEKQRLRYAALAEGSHWALRPMVQLWSWLQRSMVGYGYRSMRALGWLLICLVIGTAWFSLPAHHLIEVNEQDHQLWNPVLYTIDLLVPIVDFGNKGRWRPELGPEAWQSQWLSAALIATGWLLATTVAAGLTRMLKRP